MIKYSKTNKNLILKPTREVRERERFERERESGKMMIKKCLAISRQKHNVKMILVLVILVGLLLVRYEISCWKEKTSSTSYLRPIEKSIDVKNDVKGVRNMRLQWEIEDLKQQILDLGASGPLPSNGFSLDLSLIHI